MGVQIDLLIVLARDTNKFNASDILNCKPYVFLCFLLQNICNITPKSHDKSQNCFHAPVQQMSSYLLPFQRTNNLNGISISTINTS